MWASWMVWQMFSPTTLAMFPWTIRNLFYRQTIGDIIFLTENIFCVVFGCMTNVSPINNRSTMTYFVSIIFSCHIIGILLKVFYYKFLHIWKDLTPTFDFSNMSSKRADESTHIIKKNKPQCNGPKQPGTKKDALEQNRGFFWCSLNLTFIVIHWQLQKKSI